jgi:hypothetical protein
MVARFEKADDPDMGKFDGFDPKTFYQMVPVGGTRRGFSVTSEGEEIEVAFDPPRIAEFGSRQFLPPTPFPLDRDRMRMLPRSVVKFELFGVKPGNTTLFIRGRNGKALGALLISVKKQIDKTYAICRLTDMIRSTSPWPLDTLRPMMKGVEKCFHQQANIKLTEKTPTIFEVNVNDRDLEDPLVPERILQSENTTLSHYVLFRRSPIDAILANFTIFLTWNLRTIQRDIVGQNFGQACWAEYNSTNSFENALTVGHELGHGLGLKHSGKDTLMAGDGVSRSSLLQQFEIDTINKTDEAAP